MQESTPHASRHGRDDADGEHARNADSHEDATAAPQYPDPPYNAANRQPCVVAAATVAW